MTKPTKGKRSESEGVSEVMLRRAALAYAAAAHLDPSDLRRRRCWRALSVAAIGMAATIQEAAEPPKGHPPSRALEDLDRVDRAILPGARLSRMPVP